MAGVEISALPAVIAPQLSDIFPIVQSGVTSREGISQLNTLLGANIQLSSTAQVTGLNTMLAGFVPLSGGTMTGPLILNTNAPTSELQAASKGYVDMFAAGLTVILATQAATTVNLNATQVGAGVGATLTNAGTQVAFSVDGYSASVNDRILVKNQTLTQHNGIYVVTTLGSGSTNWVLTRSTDYDTNTQIVPGTLIAVNNGTVNGTTSWLETAIVSVVDTDPVLFSQFTFAPTAFFQIANNLSEGTPATMLVNLGLGTPTGTGNVVRQTSPTLITPNIGVASATSITVPSGEGFVDAGNGALLVLVYPSNAVNAVVISSAITGSTPSMTALGSDANISLVIGGKGTGCVQISGTGTNDNAFNGFVGEDISSVVLEGAGVALTTNVIRDITSIALTAGDWDIYANFGVVGATGTSLTFLNGWIGTSSATAVNGTFSSTLFYSTANIIGVTPINMTVPFLRVSSAVPFTAYLSCVATFGVSTLTASGQIEARRRR